MVRKEMVLGCLLAVLPGLSSAEDVAGVKPLPKSLAGYTLGQIVKPVGTKGLGACPNSDPKYGQVVCEINSRHRIMLIRVFYADKTLTLTALGQAAIKKYGRPLPKAYSGDDCMAPSSAEIDTNCVIWRNGNRSLSVFQMEVNEKGVNAGNMPEQSVGMVLIDPDAVRAELEATQKAAADKAAELLK